MMWLAPGSASTWLLDALLPWRRRPAIEHDAVAYLERLPAVNSARIKNDFLERVTQSRQLLELEIRVRLPHPPSGRWRMRGKHKRLARIWSWPSSSGPTACVERSEVQYTAGAFRPIGSLRPCGDPGSVHSHRLPPPLPSTSDRSPPRTVAS